jgi:ATP-dependent DNA helicase RecG
MGDLFMMLQQLKGVGPKVQKHLNSLGIWSVYDAINYYPRDYEDRSNVKPIIDMKDGEMVSLIGEVSVIYPIRRTNTGKTLNKIVFKDESGFIAGVWFNQPYIKNNFTVGEKVLLYGRVSRKMGEVQIIEPQYEKNMENGPSGINPIYPTNKYLSQKVLRKVMSEALKHIDDEVTENIPESLEKYTDLLILRLR